LHVYGVHARRAHGERPSRDFQPHGVLPLPYDDELRAHDVRQLWYDVLLLVLTFYPPPIVIVAITLLTTQNFRCQTVCIVESSARDITYFAGVTITLINLYRFLGLKKWCQPVIMPFVESLGGEKMIKTRDVMLLLDQDKPLKEIRKYVDLKYSRYGPPTPTPPVP